MTLTKDEKVILTTALTTYINDIYRTVNKVDSQMFLDESAMNLNLERIKIASVAEKLRSKLVANG